MHKKKQIKRGHEKNLENSKNFPRNFQFVQCGSNDNPSSFINKGKQI